VRAPKNTGNERVTLRGWFLRDKSGHVYRFAAFRLGSGKSVTIHSGRSNDDRNEMSTGMPASTFGTTMTTRRR
jgi:hypothetical protein